MHNDILANLSHLPEPSIEAIRRTLRGEVLEGSNNAIAHSLPDGPVAAVVEVARSTGVLDLLGPPSRQRDMVLGMPCARVCEPASKNVTDAIAPSLRLLAYAHT